MGKKSEKEKPRGIFLVYVYRLIQSTAILLHSERAFGHKTAFFSAKPQWSVAESVARFISSD